MRDITPPHLACTTGFSCPAVFDDGTDLVIIGKRVHPQTLPDPDRVGHEEEAIRIPKAYLANVVARKDHLAAYRKQTDAEPAPLNPLPDNEMGQSDPLQPAGLRKCVEEDLI